MLRWSRFLCKPAPLRGLSGCREFLSVFPLIPEHLLGLALELPDPLAGDRKLLAQIGEGSWLIAIKAVAADEDAALALGESLDGLHKAARLQLPAPPRRSSPTRARPRQDRPPPSCLLRKRAAG